MIIHLSQLLMLNIEDSKTALLKKKTFWQSLFYQIFFSLISVFMVFALTFHKQCRQKGKVW